MDGGHRTYPFMTVDVFTRRRFGGNPLAVFPEARGLSDAEMQALAAEFNLSETTFVLPPTEHGADARVRIFNRTAEMDFAGHPNVGTAFVLAALGRGGDGFVFEEPAGLVRVAVARDHDGTVRGATVTAPRPLALGPEVEAATVAACARVEPRAVRTGAHPPIVATMGNPFVVAEVGPDDLGRAKPDLAAFERALEERPELGGRLALYLYALVPGSGGVPTVHARMFAPLTGTVEDAATGSAAAPLGGLLVSLHGAERERFEVVQGVEMGRPSLLHVEAWREGDGVRASVGGPCVAVLKGEASVS